MDADKTLEALWEPIFKIAESDGAQPMSKHKGLWRRDLADDWILFVNGHKRILTANWDDGRGMKVAPFNALAVNDKNFFWLVSFSAFEAVAAGGQETMERLLAALQKTVEGLK